ncbi:TonB-dependent receptor [Cerasicoccus fimbriatus]|uniref:TonB-dependent receptor n=1 Tax=Cerasicoccus fimbriatus TaxID=3014554 RepID=UPI0022B3E6A4|nr:TonB-dependent receptor [Cerasicoccus sp. TK19100]
MKRFNSIFNRQLLCLTTLACWGILLAPIAAYSQGTEASETEDQPFNDVEVVDAKQPAAPAPYTGESAGVGNIIGQVFDPEKRKFVRGANVVLLWPGAEAAAEADDYEPQEKTVTNKEGEFRFTDIPAGFYTILVVEDGYKEEEVKDFEVLANSANRVNVQLTSLTAAEQAGEVFQLEEFAAGGELVTDSRIAMDDLRRDSAGSMDFLTSEDFSKYAATDLADVVKRLPGVNVVEGKFAVVRGLSDRYNSTLVNGLPVPSPDPLRQGLQLDLFPTSIIDSVVTNKQFLPYMPSNSSGAAFELNTKAYPEEFTTWFSAGARFNSNAMDSYLRDPNSSTDDLFGFGKGSRPMNPGTSRSRANQLNLPSPTFIAQPGNAPVGGKFSLGFGDTTKVFGRNLGVIASASYDSSYKTQFGVQQDRYGASSYSVGNAVPGFESEVIPFPPGTPLYDRFLARFNANLKEFIPGSLYNRELAASDVRYDVENSIGTVQIAALGGFAFDLDPEGTNQLSFNYLFSQNSQDFVQRKSNGSLPPQFRQTGNQVTDLTSNSQADGFVLVGQQDDGNQLFNKDTISYEERNLKAYQLNGEHLIEELNDLEIFWGASYATTSSDTPGQTTFEYAYQIDDGSAYPGSNTPDAEGYWLPDNVVSGISPLTQTWRDIDEDVYGARADLTYELEFLNNLDGQIRSGMYYENASRRTDQIELIYPSNNNIPKTGGEPAVFQTPEELQYALVRNIDAANNTNLGTNTSFANNTRKINAFYGMLTLPVFDNLKFTGGARFEDLRMTANGDAELGIYTLDQILNTPLPGLETPPPGFTGPTTNGEVLGWTNPNEQGDIRSDAVLPGVSMTYDITDDITFRAGYSKTIARPSFREMAPYFSTELETGDLIIGNPTLELSPVESYDARLEYRFGDGDLIAASVFYKNVENPIERVLLRAPGNVDFLSFINNPDRAIVKGFELETRTSLSNFFKDLKYVSIGANWTMIDATVAYPESVWQSYFRYTSNGIPSGPFVGNDGPPNGNNRQPQDRRLFDQPEWIVNADVTFSHPDLGTTLTLSVFSQSDVLTGVGSGSNGSVDQFTGSYYQLDLTFQQRITENLTLKFAVSNITDTKRSIYYSNDFVDETIDRLSYKVGQNYRVALDYNF